MSTKQRGLVALVGMIILSGLALLPSQFESSTDVDAIAAQSEGPLTAADEMSFTEYIQWTNGGEAESEVDSLADDDGNAHSPPQGSADRFDL